MVVVGKTKYSNAVCLMYKTRRVVHKPETGLRLIIESTAELNRPRINDSCPAPDSGHGPLHNDSGVHARGYGCQTDKSTLSNARVATAIGGGVKKSD